MIEVCSQVNGDFQCSMISYATMCFTHEFCVRIKASNAMFSCKVGRYQPTNSLAVDWLRISEAHTAKNPCGGDHLANCCPRCAALSLAMQSTTPRRGTGKLSLNLFAFIVITKCRMNKYLRSLNKLVTRPCHHGCHISRSE